MSWRDEEQHLIDAAIAAAEDCAECGVPIGFGSCLGCQAVAASCPELFEDEEYEDDR
ncbi:MAG TPA: hypothetical protein VFV87_01225 [Pirellulaceae bacterium]|nr:hypothetical protein [Pirellulaceae bacterium]